MRRLKNPVTYCLPKIRFFHHFISIPINKNYLKMAQPSKDPTTDFADSSSSTKANNDATTTPQKNAFTELMKPKPPSPPKKDHSQRSTHTKTENAVLIKDLYPKATVHLLLLPRSPTHNLLHPHDAFADPQFLSMIREEASSAAKLAAAELSRIIGPFSKSNKARDEAMDLGQIPYDKLPPGRDYLKEIKVGIHAHPSMDHLHVHIISRDMRSEKLKGRNHYQSFCTPFFIELEHYPLDENDQRRSSRYHNGNLRKDFVCWRCGKEFGNKFSVLKKHLEEEFEEWKNE
ncbi:HIT-like domain-containing protein [Podospora fimiseda]|uniref:HIT-like domain-containing protein n=1 Tax=Podospora fimiseda TaxID=252190 RepID=A0AAN7BWM5_9PEZI|nr:HIT-like domain-containing protein [Podospora fimiseda]